MIFGRRDLRIGGSKAKFDVQVAVDVRLVAAPPKPNKISEKLIFDREFSPKHFFRRQKMKR